jgi:hypothetical protein
VTAGVVTAALLLRTRAGPWLHIVTDVINHFYRPYSVPPPPWAAFRPENVRRFTVQQRIEDRCARALAHLLGVSRATHLIVVAHSQGSVIAVDVLSRGRARRLRNAAGVREIRLATMGSPLTHLYQHYFPLRYPPLTAHTWNGLYRNLTRWVNLYRRDDFVGTRVDFPANRPPVANALGVTAASQTQLAPGGHTGYWRERAALEELAKLFT